MINETRLEGRTGSPLSMGDVEGEKPDTQRERRGKEEGGNQKSDRVGYAILDAYEMPKERIMLSNVSLILRYESSTSPQRDFNNS